MVGAECFVDAAALADVLPGALKGVALCGHAVALGNVEGRVFAIGNLCLRCGAPLTEGTLHERIVACHGCDWKYDLADGQLVGLPTLRARVFEVQVDQGRIKVALPLPLHPHEDPLDA